MISVTAYSERSLRMTTATTYAVNANPAELREGTSIPGSFCKRDICKNDVAKRLDYIPAMQPVAFKEG
jgi:hypothetical protein